MAAVADPKTANGGSYVGDSVVIADRDLEIATPEYPSTVSTLPSSTGNSKRCTERRPLKLPLVSYLAGDEVLSPQDSEGDGDSVIHGDLGERYSHHTTGRGKLLSDASQRSLYAHFGHQLTDEMRQELSDILTFGSDEELLRGMPLEKVLRCSGLIFKSHDGSAQTFMLSKRVKRLRTFISHNWSVKRSGKFVALSVHFHLERATAASLVLVNTVSIITNLSTNDLMQKISDFVCRIIFVPVFIIFLFFGLSLLACFRAPDHPVFLDKTCIHQVDKDIQRRGLLKLGAFIRKSDEMVILYTDVYLRKLWTVYEVASYLATHGVKGMKIIPLYTPKGFIGIVILTWIISLLKLVLEHVPKGEAFENFITALHMNLMMLIFTVHCHQCHRDREQAKLRLSTFNVQDCICAVESDRPIIYRNIAALMRAMGEVDPDCTSSCALAAFDSLVRERLSIAFCNSFGGSGPGYLDFVVVGFACKGAGVLDHMVWQRDVPASLIVNVLSSGFYVFFGVPMLLKLLEYTASFTVDFPKSDVRFILPTLISTVFLAVLYLVCEMQIDDMVDHLKKDNINGLSAKYLVIFVVTAAVSVLFAIYMIWDKKYRRRGAPAEV
eukprot:TRINITY_DN11206_c0_g1_i3.p1 TRINITY_DN11206_c0_g1~~TRINITY_DN11206_c0_g1_i3.p1  ORF type:complete len:608 (+),score=105.50 TRINITY_DN11206_c0_g1_i3:56-1879(+)